MFGITDKLRSAAATGGLVAVAGTLALMGLVWVTIAGFTVLALYVAAPVAMLIIGLVLMTPLAVVLIQHRGSDKDKSEPVPAATPPGEYAALARLAGTAQSLAEKSPLAGAALALGAAYFASRSPTTSSLAVQIIAEAVDQWAKSKPVTPAPVRESPDDPAI